MRDSSYNVVVDRLQQFAEGHFYIKSFKHDTLDAIDIFKGMEYPIMQVIPGSVTPSQGQLAYTFDIVFADLARKKTDEELNTREVISDMTRLALDLLFEIKNGRVLFGDQVQLAEGSSITSFIDGYENTITGVTLSLTLNVQDTWNACIIPSDWSTGGTGYPSEGMRVTSIPVLDEGNFVVNAYELDFRGSGVTVTRTGNTAIITITGGGGGGGITCDDLPTCEVIVEINDAIDTLTASLGALTSTVSGLSATVGGIQNDITAIQGEQVTQNNNITALQNDLSALSNSLAPVAFSGDYNDLTNKPSLDFVESVTAGDDVTVGGTASNPTVGVTPHTFLRLLGTEVGFPMEGDIEVLKGQRYYFDNGLYRAEFKIQKENDAASIRMEDIAAGTTREYFFRSNFINRENVARIQDILPRIWTKAGAPTTSDDSVEGYIVGSLIFDIINKVMYVCQDNTATAAVWTKETFGGVQNFKMATSAIQFPSGATSWLLLDGFSSAATFLTSERVACKIPKGGEIGTFSVYITNAQPASGSLVLEIFSGTDPTSLSATGVQITIPAGSAAGEYTTSSTATINNGDYIAVRVVNNASANSARLSTHSSQLNVN